jgi:ketosteroid isomerase-like protein
MSTVETMSREAALERFDHAAGAFRQALLDAPAESLGYLPPGDDYALGGLVHHVDAVLANYLGVIEAMVASGFGETTAPDASRLFEEAAVRARAGLAAEEREPALDATAELHGRVRERVEAAAEDAWTRAVPVRFGGGEPYPTRLADVLGWLTDHYVEHAVQVGSLLAGWRTLAAVEAFGHAFDCHDVDAIMACVTEDCVFENTSPAPDGTRLAGADEVGAFWRRFFDSTPSARFETEEAFAAGDRAVVRWTFRWDEGADNRGSVRGVDVFRVRDGRVAEKLSYVKG